MRIKNISATKTAHGVTATIEPCSPDTSPSEAAPTFQFSSDNTNWSNTLLLGDLAPGVISAVFYVRANLPQTFPAGLQEAKVATTYTSYL
jgi:hypothetical protein